MAFLPRLISFSSSFRSPLLRAIIPSVTAAVAIQAAFGIPSTFAQTERFYDLSGSLTFLSVAALSLYLPSLRAGAVAAKAGASSGDAAQGLSALLAPFRAQGVAGAVWNWRQVLLTGAVTIWAVRLGSYLFQRVLSEGKDSRFDEIKTSPPKFAVAWFAQAMWVSLNLMPVIALNAVPALAMSRPIMTSSRLLFTDVLGLALWVSGFTFEAVADYQKSRWVEGKKTKQHDEEFLTRGLFGVCQFPNYFGEMTLWTGIATLAAGTLARKPVQLALGFTGGPASILGTTALSFVSPAFTIFLLTKVSGIPMSEKKYDERYGDRKDYQEWKKNTARLIPYVY